MAKPRRRRKGYVPQRRNALYRLAAEFKRNQPLATAATAWQHFTAIAQAGCHDVLLGYNAAADELTYVPDVERLATKTVKHRCFAVHYHRLGNLSA
jgi:hypothetical protein